MTIKDGPLVDNTDQTLLLKNQDGEEFSGRFNANTIKSLRCWPENDGSDHSTPYDVSGKATKKKKNKDARTKKSQEGKVNCYFFFCAANRKSF